MAGLEIMNFGDCLIKTQGAQYLATAIKGNNPKLQKVILSFNEIGARGGKAVAEAVKGKASLVELDLNGA
jgi:Ran GTPase-activating protein 1